jgi:hypothetical protein
MGRPEIRGRVSPAAHQAWDRLVTTEGVTVSGLLEALGQELADGRWRPTQRTIRLARTIDRERHSRS